MTQYVTTRQYRACIESPYWDWLSMQFEGPNIRQRSGVFDSATSSYVSRVVRKACRFRSPARLLSRNLRVYDLPLHSGV
jgi:hypothetical protein